MRSRQLDRPLAWGAAACLAGGFCVAPAGAVPPRQQERSQQQPTFSARVDAPGEPIVIRGYADFRHGGVFIVDGQRIRIWAETVMGGEVSNPSEVRLGYEVEAEGPRLADGTVLARRFEAKPNDGQFMETQVVAAANRIEREWLQAGRMYEDEETSIGPIISWGDRVKRVEAIMARLLPPYVQPGAVRVHVVETVAWNASAMANGSIWVFTGLIDATTDDELAIILGHELAHFTYEHSRRAAKSGIWKRALAGLGAGFLGGLLAGGAAGDVANMAALIGTQAWVNDYGRELEDQADRVGLRYAFEAGYDVYAGPILWQRFLEHYGQLDPATNFILSTHSRPSERIDNIQREIQINYRHEVQPGR